MNASTKKYYIQSKGRGLQSADLTKTQLKVLLELQDKGLLELESIKLA